MISYVGWDYCGISHGSVVMWYHILMVVLRVVIVEKISDRGTSPSSRHSWWRMSLRTHSAPFWCARLVAICEHVGVMDLYQN